MELSTILTEIGLKIDVASLVLICGLIEIFKKYFADRVKNTDVYVVMAAVLSIGAAFLMTPLTVSSVIFNSVAYFVLSTLVYDSIIAPLKSTEKKE